MEHHVAACIAEHTHRLPTSVVALFGGQGSDTLRELRLLWEKSTRMRAFLKSQCNFIYGRLSSYSDEHPAAAGKFERMTFEILIAELHNIPAARIALTTTLALSQISDTCLAGTMTWRDWENLHAVVGYSSGSLSALALSKARAPDDLMNMATTIILLAVDIGQACYRRTYSLAAENSIMPKGSWMIGVAGFTQTKLGKLLQIFKVEQQCCGPFQPEISLINGERMFSVTVSPRWRTDLKTYLQSKGAHVVELNVELPYHTTEMQDVVQEAIASLTLEEKKLVDDFACRRLCLPVWSGVGQLDAPDGHAVMDWMAAEVCEAKIYWPEVCRKLQERGAALLDCGNRKSKGIAYMTSRASRGARILGPAEVRMKGVDCCTCSHAFAKLSSALSEIVKELGADDLFKEISGYADLPTCDKEEDTARKMSGLSDCCV